MASPKIIAFTVYDDTGAPLPGAAGDISIDTYVDETGTPITTPTIVEIGGGGYYFVPNFTTDHGAFYSISTGHFPAYLNGYARPEDFYTDDIKDLMDVEFGRWEIFNSGPDANRLVLYRQDSSVLKKFDLYDSNGDPTSTNPFTRDPV